MDERGANIDLVFRNGLKDYEVLPPADIWDRISPVIRKRQRPLIIFRSAAIIAVALSLSFLAYRWSRELTNLQQETIQAQNTEALTPLSSGDVLNSSADEGRGKAVLISNASLTEMQDLTAVSPAEDLTIHSIQNPSASGVAPDMKLTLAGNTIPSMTGSSVAGSPETTFNYYLPSQEDMQQDKPRRWSLSALVSPSYYNRISTGNNEAMAQIMTPENPLISYSGGVALSYRINKRFSVQSGLYYSSVGQQLSGISAYGGFEEYNQAKNAGFSVITASGTVTTNNNDVFLLDNYKGGKVISNYSGNEIDPVKAELQYLDNSLRQNFSYLELPVVIRFKVVDKTLDFNVIGGFSSNLLVNNKVSAGKGEKYQVGSTEGLNMVTFSSSLGMGMEYSFSSNLSLNLEPTLRYYLNPFGEIPGIKIHPYSFGIFSGLSFRF